VTHVTSGKSADEPGEGEGLLAAARGDPEAFGRFYDQHYPLVAGYFYRRTFCAHTAAELAAETFAQALASIARYNPREGTERGWLFGIAGNLYKQWLRKGVITNRARRKLRIQTPVLSADDHERIEQLVDTAELRQGLRQCLDRLSPAVRDAVLMRVALDRPYEEVASALGCSVGAARVRVTRGLHALAEMMEVGP